MPGDTIVIGGGTYREWVNPKNGGLGNNQRIVYINAEGEHPVISGAEVIGGWAPFKGSVWHTEADNTLFGEYNPYADEIFGDWYDGLGQTHHTGEVFLNGTAMYEAASLAALSENGREQRKGCSAGSRLSKRRKRYSMAILAERIQTIAVRRSV